MLIQFVTPAAEIGSISYNACYMLKIWRKYKNKLKRASYFLDMKL